MTTSRFRPLARQGAGHAVDAAGGAAADEKTAVGLRVGADERQHHVVGPFKFPRGEFGVEVGVAVGVGVMGQVFVHDVPDDSQLQRAGGAVEVDAPGFFAAGQLVLHAEADGAGAQFLQHSPGVGGLGILGNKLSVAGSVAGMFVRVSHKWFISITGAIGSINI